VDATAAVQNWLNGTTNSGFLILRRVRRESSVRQQGKRTTSHPAQLLVFLANQDDRPAARKDRPERPDLPAPREQPVRWGSQALRICWAHGATGATGPTDRTRQQCARLRSGAGNIDYDTTANRSVMKPLSLSRKWKVLFTGSVALAQPMWPGIQPRNRCVLQAGTGRWSAGLFVLVRAVRIPRRCIPHRFWPLPAGTYRSACAISQPMRIGITTTTSTIRLWSSSDLPAQWNRRRRRCATFHRRAMIFGICQNRRLRSAFIPIHDSPRTIFIASSLTFDAHLSQRSAARSL